ncbi:MAG: aminodeoxychorismate/anthranilate synthase component II [Bacteroidetes bacterium]|nr:aminodeoxychorismate/anthranilate synthase component II [Bacteroidota bacterium]
MKVLILDNYDSFTFNLFHLVEQFDGISTDVFKNDEITLEEINRYDKVILSPGPGLPAESGIMIPLIKEFSGVKPILGVCLGHQAIAVAFGGELFNMEKVQHGVSRITCVSDPAEKLFRNIPSEFKTGHYHSWMVSRKNLPACFHVTAVDRENRIMALRHRSYDLCSVQFHPESILTEHGKTLIGNWLSG